MSLGSRIPTLVLVAIYVVAAGFGVRDLVAAPAPVLAGSSTALAAPSLAGTPLGPALPSPAPLAATPVSPTLPPPAPTEPAVTPTPMLTPVPPVRVLRSCPIDDDTDLLPAAPLHIVFDQPMDTSPDALVASIAPELPFSIEWLDAEDLILHTAPRQEGVEYRLTLNQARSSLGGTLERPFSLTFAQGGDGAPIPILMYHQVCEMPADTDPEVLRWAVTPQSFEGQLDLLTGLGAHVVSLGQIVAYLQRGEPLPARPVALTFDDGFLSPYTNAVPLLKARGMTATFFVLPVNVGYLAFMDWSQVKELADAGFSIGGHSYDHVAVDVLGAEQADRQFGEAKRLLEAKSGAQVTLFAYPFGVYSPWAAQQLADYGYTAAVTTDPMVRQHPGRVMFLSRIHVEYDQPLSALSEMLPWD